jgi:hypothetical protein
MLAGILEQTWGVAIYWLGKLVYLKIRLNKSGLWNYGMVLN